MLWWTTRTKARLSLPWEIVVFSWQAHCNRSTQYTLYLCKSQCKVHGHDLCNFLKIIPKTNPLNSTLIYPTMLENNIIIFHCKNKQAHLPLSKEVLIVLNRQEINVQPNPDIIFLTSRRSNLSLGEPPAHLFFLRLFIKLIFFLLV